MLGGLPFYQLVFASAHTIVVFRRIVFSLREELQLGPPGDQTVTHSVCGSVMRPGARIPGGGGVEPGSVWASLAVYSGPRPVRISVSPVSPQVPSVPGRSAASAASFSDLRAYPLWLPLLQ